MKIVMGIWQESTTWSASWWHIFHDATSGFIRAKNQISLVAGETLMAKECFEQWLWVYAATEIHLIHRTMESLMLNSLWRNWKYKFHTQPSSGVDAHHENTFAGQSIQPIMYITRTFMVHNSLHWTKYGADNHRKMIWLKLVHENSWTLILISDW